MDDETTTESPVASGGQTIQGVAIDDQGMAIPLPDTTEPETPAVSEADEGETEEESTEGGEETPTPLPDEDEAKLKSFAKGQGIEDVSELTPREKSLLKSAYDNKAEYERHRQKTSELEKTLTTASDDTVEEVAQYQGQDPDVLRRVQRMEIKDSVRDFYSNHPDARDMEQDMISALQKKPHLAGDLEALYAVVKVNSLGSVKSQGKREALESLAQKQQAAVPRGNAVTSNTNSNKITPQNVDSMVASHDQAWFRANYKAINEAMAG